MTRMRWLALFAVIALVVTACGTTAETTTTAAAEETTTTTAAAEETTTTEAGPGFEGMSVAAANCDYGGKISSIEATGPLEVTFTLCSPAPAFPQIVAFTPFGIQPAEHLEATGGAPARQSDRNRSVRPRCMEPGRLDIVYQANPTTGATSRPFRRWSSGGRRKAPPGCSSSNPATPTT